jgi:hypothetical protein
MDMNANLSCAHRWTLSALVPALLVTLAAFGASDTKPSAPSAAERMQQAGAEEQQLKRRAGTWTVKATFRPTPDAKPMVTEQLVAERKMVGLYLEEIMHPDAGAKTPDFRRIAYQYYSRVEGRWQYVSIDTRFPVGIMPAYSFGKEADGKLTMVFESLAFVGLGKDVEGRMIRSNLEITRDSDDHELVRQYWVQSDGTGRPWPAVEYEYTRRR